MGCLKIAYNHLEVVYESENQSLGRGKNEVGLIVAGLNHSLHGMDSEDSKTKGTKEYVATVVSESSDNVLEAEGIGSVILNRAEHKGIEVDAGFLDKIGGAREFQGIKDNARDYNKIMKYP